MYTNSLYLTANVETQACATVSDKSVAADLCDSGFSASHIAGNDDMTKFYTGLPSYKVFELVFFIVMPHVPKKWSSASKLKSKDELLLVLMHLRLNLLVEDTIFQFQNQLFAKCLICG